MSFRKTLNRGRTLQREPDEEPIYFVQRIENKRLENGKVQYYLKWSGYPRSQNTWEPVENLYCTDLIRAYEESIMPKTTETMSPERNSDLGGKNNCKPVGFKRGLEPEKIIGATQDVGGQLMFLVLWKGFDETDLVPAGQANIMCPQHVIQYYEELLTFESPTVVKKRRRTKK